MRILTIVLLGLLLTFNFIAPTTAQENRNGRFVAQECPFQVSRFFQRVSIECGTVTMPEDHAQPDGARITVAVAILRGENTESAAEPVLYLPEQFSSGMVRQAGLLALLDSVVTIAEQRDVILLDPRGTGLSEPTLQCSPAATNGNVGDITSQCIDQLTAQGIDYHLYSIQQIAADYATIGEALGYEQVNLVGSDFGSTLGLILIRDYPEVIRSAVFSEVQTPATDTYGTAAENFERAFTDFADSCDEDWLCGFVYGDLKITYMNISESLAESPLELSVDGEDYLLSAQGFSEVVRSYLLSDYGIVALPAFLTALDQQDYPVVEQMLSVSAAAGMPISAPQVVPLLTMICPQVNAVAAGDITSATTSEFPNDMNIVRLCSTIDFGNQFDTSLPANSVPVLFFVGAYDPISNLEVAERTVAQLENGTMRMIPNHGYGVGEADCVIAMTQDFLNDPHAELNDGCIVELEASAFILQTTVTRKPIYVLTGILSLVALLGVGRMMVSGIRGRKQVAWWAAIRRLGWMPLITGSIVFLLATFDVSLLEGSGEAVSAVMLLMPVIMALQAGGVFSPDDEPGLEIQLAAPRPISWVVIERFVVVCAIYTVIGVIAGGINLWVNPNQPQWMILIGWLPSAIFISAIAVLVTLRSRLPALGMLIGFVLLFIFGAIGNAFIPGMSFGFPFNIIQPFLWPLHLFPQVEDFTTQDMLVNRTFLTVASVALLMRALQGLHDPEMVLLNMSQRKSRKTQDVHLPSKKLGGKLLHAVQPDFGVLSQFVGVIRYEFKIVWRRRALKVLTIALFFMGMVITFINTDYSDLLYPGTMNATQIYYANSYTIVNLASVMYLTVVLFLLPVLVADTVIRDKTLRVHEIITSTPLARMVYVLAKGCAVVLAGFASVTGTMALLTPIWYTRTGAFSMLPLIELLIGIMLFLTPTVLMAVFAGASQSSTGKAFGLTALWVMIPQFLPDITLVSNIFPSRVAIFERYITQPMLLIAQGVQQFEPILLDSAVIKLLIGMVVQALLAAALAYWRMTRENA